MIARMVVAAALLLVIASNGLASDDAALQAKPAQPQPPATLATPTQPPATLPTPTTRPAPSREGQPFNVKVDVTITEQTGAAAPFKKTVSVAVGEGTTALVRSQATFSGGTPNPLNVDVGPTVTATGKIRLMMSVQYDAPAPPLVADAATGRAGDGQTIRSALGALTRTELRQNIIVMLENGKPLVVSQSADPVGDRKVTIEVTATILK